ncbi:MAG: NAD(P)H-dependent glycerol-3-phosphate dehydrogenase [Erysipelotrichaceae bacterium]
MKVTVIGSGSWGTALAQVLVDNRHDVSIWGNDLDEVVDIHMYHLNEKHFPGVHLHEDIKATNDLKTVRFADVLVLAVPSGFVADACELINKYFTKPVLIINAAIGFDPTSHKRLSVVIKEKLRPELFDGIVSLAGPTHAEEVILRMFTRIEAAGSDEAALKRVQSLLTNDYFRVSRNTDVIGAEIGAALKNVIAIASGIFIGLGYGDNARAALMTRGLSEMIAYGTYFGGKPETYLGLSGVGALIGTCTSEHSRNFQAGLLIGNNDSAKVFWETNIKTVEGALAVKIVIEEAAKAGLDLPVNRFVNDILYGGQTPSQAILNLLKRENNAE